MRERIGVVGLMAATAIAGIAATRLGAQVEQAPIARYAMDVGTASGFGAGGVSAMSLIMHRGGGGAP